MRFVSLVLGLGLEHSCPWPRECLSSERLSLALASDFFCVLGLEPCVLDSTSAPGPPSGYAYVQARSQDLEKGGGYFETVRSVQTTLTRIFIDHESVSDGLSEI